MSGNTIVLFHFTIIFGTELIILSTDINEKTCLIMWVFDLLLRFEIDFF